VPPHFSLTVSKLDNGYPDYGGVRTRLMPSHLIGPNPFLLEGNRVLGCLAIFKVPLRGEGVKPGGE
jgi:hypothetical protein